jgi:hypothetical protein
VALTARVACKLQPNFDFGIFEWSSGFEGLEPSTECDRNDFNGIRGYLATRELNIRQLHSKHETK